MIDPTNPQTSRNSQSRIANALIGDRPESSTVVEEAATNRGGASRPSVFPAGRRTLLPNRITGLLSQGISAKALALSIALGVGLSCFPVFGTTTILCTVVALLFRLNLPAIQVGNYLALPLQLVLFVPFLRLGERLTRAPRLPLSPQQLLAMARVSPNQAMSLLLTGQWHAIVGWIVVALPMTILLVLLLRPLMELLFARAGRGPAPSAVTIQR